MAKTKLSREQKKQIIGLLEKSEMTVIQIADVLNVPMESVRSIKSHHTMGTYVSNNDSDIDDIVSAQETSLSIEKDLQTFLCNSLDQIETGLKLHNNGKEFATEIGRIDILAEDKDANLVVIELKAGKAKDSALGQILGYMGFVANEIANDKKVRGIIIANDFDERLKYAVRNLPDITLKSYNISFTFNDIE